MLLHAIEFQALNDTTIQFPLSVIFEYESFRSITPDSLFIGGFPIEIPFGEGLVTRLDMSLIVSIPVELIPIKFNAMVISSRITHHDDDGIRYFRNEYWTIAIPWRVIS